jgi:hypothetical protein
MKNTRFIKTHNLILSVLCIGLLLTACNPESKFKSELQQIDFNLEKLDSVESVINGIEFDSLSYMYEIALNNEQLIKRYYQSDTIDKALADVLVFNKGIRKSFADVDKVQQNFMSELSALKTQFRNLKTDILNGLYNKEQIEHFLAIESNDTKLLINGIDGFYKTQQIHKVNFYKVTPILDQYTSKLMNDHQE